MTKRKMKNAHDVDLAAKIAEAAEMAPNCLKLAAISLCRDMKVPWVRPTKKYAKEWINEPIPQTT